MSEKAKIKKEVTAEDVFGRKEAPPRFFNSDKYEDGLTKQSFKDSTDINKILHRAAAGQSISHLAKHGAVYGDFSDIDDLLVAHERLTRGQKIFDDLPAELRKEFNNDLGSFFNFVNDPANTDRLPEIFPELAKPQSQLPDFSPTGLAQRAEQQEQLAQNPPENEGGTPPSETA